MTEYALGHPVEAVAAAVALTPRELEKATQDLQQAARERLTSESVETTQRPRVPNGFYFIW
jgi:hypothetical protein